MTNIFWQSFLNNLLKLAIFRSDTTVVYCLCFESAPKQLVRHKVSSTQSRTLSPSSPSPGRPGSPRPLVSPILRGNQLLSFSLAQDNRHLLPAPSCSTSTSSPFCSQPALCSSSFSLISTLSVDCFPPRARLLLHRLRRSPPLRPPTSCRHPRRSPPPGIPRRDRLPQP